MTILNIRDANTGDFVAVDLDNPSGTIYVNDGNTGDIIPVVLGGGGSEVSFASDAEAAAKTVTDKVLSPSNLAASGVLPRALTDYSNVVVVDPDGNGDYTTLVAALASITDASVGKRYKVYLFGAISEPAVVTAKDYVDIVGEHGHTITFQNSAHYLRLAEAHYGGLRFTNGSIRPATGKSSTLFDCVLQQINIDQVGSIEINSCQMLSSLVVTAEGATLILRGLQWDRAGAIGAVTTPLMLKVYNCNITGTTGGLTMSGYNSVIVFENSHISVSGASAKAISISGDDGSNTYVFKNSTIEGLGATGTGLELEAGITDFIAENCTFRGSSGLAVNCGAAWANAPFYHCRFRGGTTNVTANAGTANGTSVTF